LFSQEIKCNGKCDDETLPILDKLKHLEGGIQRTKKKDACPRKQNNHLIRRTTKGTSSSQTPFFHEKISNKESGRAPKRTFKLKEPSLIALTCFKIETTYARCNATNTLCL
jgi:hypothetical protein